MLKSLYDYALRNDLVLPAGYGSKTVKAYILLYADGTFQDIELGGDEAVPAPDIGSLANGKDKSNVLLEKRSVVIPVEPTLKSQFFLSALEDGGKIEPMLAICAQALKNPETAAAIRSRLDENKIKDSDRITFKVDFCSILQSAYVKDWWLEYRKQFSASTSNVTVPCLITGLPTVPLATTPPIKGLQVVGGFGNGDALICFDKTAFCSYDLKKAANAPVSEEGFAAVKAALDDLLSKDKAPVLAGMKFVHWFDRIIPPEEDPVILSMDFGIPFEVSGEEDEDDEEEDDEGDSSLSKEVQRESEKRFRALVNSVKSGEQVTLDKNTSYHILLLSGVNGRVMIRRYERGSYRELCEKLDSWHNDLQLVNQYGTGVLKPCKLSARLMRLLKYQKKDSKPFERLGKELAGITPQVISSILNGAPLPDAAAARALAYIRSSMLSSDEDTAGSLFGRDAAVWQWLKVWLLRNRGKRGQLMSEYNPEYSSNAYHSGALMAVYEAIQNAAMPSVNVTVAQRYYASAIQSPALVLGTLSKLSIHHLEKMENKWLAEELRAQLYKISTSIQGKIPTTLNLEGQSEFALGYYQMGAQLNREKQERIAKAKASNAGQNDIDNITNTEQ